MISPAFETPEELHDQNLVRMVAKIKCEQDHLFFARYFFKAQNSVKFLVNWHHRILADIVEDVIEGRKKNVTISISPGSSKTQLLVVNFIARGLARNPWARFLHLSGSDTLASINSAAARDIVSAEEYQALWPLKIAVDSKAKKKWNVLVGDKPAGGVYATATGGQVTGFRAGHMSPGFQGAIIIDDPLKPEDAFSRTKSDTVNRQLLTTVKSRKANPDTPVILIMQRLSENDPIGFIKNGNFGGHWDHVTVPAVIDKAYVDGLDEKYRNLIPESEIVDGRFSYWPYKEPIQHLLEMERGEGVDQTGARVSRYVFTSQYQQAPKALGGNIIHGEDFRRYSILPKIKWRMVFVDTAQKVKQRNDYSVFEEWGLSIDGHAILIEMERGRWEAPELQRRAVAFWARAKDRDVEKFGQLRKMKVEDKASGTGLIQTIKLPPYNIPVEGIERPIDKLTRVMDGLPYIEAGQVWLPEAAPFTADFVTECESFTSDDSHDFDDQIDPMLDAINEMLAAGNKMKVWAALAQNN